MRRLRVLLLTAFALRATAAVVTEFRPIFPAYYYTDAALLDRTALDMTRAWKMRTEYEVSVAPHQRAQAFLLACLYSAAGHHPLLGKLVNALLGTVMIAGVYFAAASAFDAPIALASAASVALWPSHIFFSSQLFKDSAILASCWVALGGLMRAGAGGSLWAGAAALAALMITGFFRSHLLLTTAFACAAGLVLDLFSGRPRGRQAALLAGVLLCVPGFYGLSKWAFRGPLADSVVRRPWPPQPHSLVPQTFDAASGRYVKPLSPEGLSETRRIRQLGDQEYALKMSGRAVNTQLFPNLVFQSWLDVATFLPKGALYVLFMPLPGLYPLDGNLGRLLSAAENSLLLLFCLLALGGAARSKLTPARASLLLFFAAMTAGSALLEFDLGSATRHKLAYLPAVFPFAYAWLASRRSPGTGRVRVLQVLECGGPGGTGNQVAALCNGLDPERFEVGLVYNARPGCSAEEYRRACSGARTAFRVPALTREISPLSDVKAVLALRAIFREWKPDVVHLHSSKAGAVGRVAAWLSGVPRVFYTPHGYGFLQQDRGAASRALYRLAELSVSWIGTIVAVSPSEAAFARPLAWGKEVKVVCDPYLGETPASAGPEPHDGLRVGSCGRMTFARQPEKFVLLSQRLTDSRNGLKCVWIGGGEQEARVREDLENMNLLSKVEVTGWLPGEQARKKLRECDVVVHYSRWDGLPNAVLEAMAHGLPVVASDVPGCRDAVVHGETGFLAGTEKELLERTLELLDDPELRRKLGEAGRRRVAERFSAEAALSSLTALYEGRDA